MRPRISVGQPRSLAAIDVHSPETRSANLGRIEDDGLSIWGSGGISCVRNDLLWDAPSSWNAHDG